MEKKVEGIIKRYGGEISADLTVNGVVINDWERIDCCDGFYLTLTVDILDLGRSLEDKKIDILNKLRNGEFKSRAGGGILKKYVAHFNKIRSVEFISKLALSFNNLDDLMNRLQDMMDVLSYNIACDLHLSSEDEEDEDEDSYEDEINPDHFEEWISEFRKEWEEEGFIFFKEK